MAMKQRGEERQADIHERHKGDTKQRRGEERRGQSDIAVSN
jgi:hypothetical protein